MLQLTPLTAVYAQIMQALNGVPVDERCACKPNTQDAFDAANKREKTCS